MTFMDVPRGSATEGSPSARFRSPVRDKLTWSFVTPDTTLPDRRLRHVRRFHDRQRSPPCWGLADGTAPARRTLAQAVPHTTRRPQPPCHDPTPSPAPRPARHTGGTPPVTTTESAAPRADEGEGGRSAGPAAQLVARADHGAADGGRVAGSDPQGAVRAGDAELDDRVRRGGRTGSALPRPRGAAVGGHRGVRPAVVLRPRAAEAARPGGAGRRDGGGGPARLRVRLRAGGRARWYAEACTPAAALAFLLSAPAINPIVLTATAVAFPGDPRDGPRPVRGEPARGVRDGLAVAAAGPHRLVAATGPPVLRRPRQGGGVLGFRTARRDARRAASSSSARWPRPRSRPSYRRAG